MKLFTYENYILNISEEAYCIKAFRDLVKRDRSKDRTKSMLELGYLYFMLDPRSDYSYIVDLADRHEAIVAQEGLPDGWKPDEKVKAAMKVYEELTKTTSSLLLEDTRYAIERARKFLKDLDLSELDDKGKPKYTLNNFISAIGKIPELVTKLSEAEKAITQEIAEQGRTRGEKMKTVTEDGIKKYLNDK